MWRGGIEPPALLWGSDALGVCAGSRMGGSVPPGLHSNATPHHTPINNVIGLFMSASILRKANVERLIIPPNETAAETITVTSVSQAANSVGPIQRPCRSQSSLLIICEHQLQYPLRLFGYDIRTPLSSKRPCDMARPSRHPPP